MILNDQSTDNGISTLQAPDATPPETRMKSASQAKAIYDALYLAEQQVRGPKRAMVKGLVDGNPPYRKEDLKNAGRSNACNVNWRIAEAFLNSAVGAFYDIFSEAPTYATVKLDTEDKEQAVEKSKIVTEEFDRLQRTEEGFDYNMQLSQGEMVLYGFGPFIFKDHVDWRATAGRCGDFYVPPETKSTTTEWEFCMMAVEYLPHQLYECIRNEEAAEKMGWDVEKTKRAIMDAHPKTNEQNSIDWEWYQQQLKDGSFYYSYQTGAKKIFTVHTWFKEFPKDGEAEGRISHKVFLRDDSVNSNSPKKSSADKKNGFLFEKVGRYANWDECVHAMYYDHGGGGNHHSVTGMGVKMYAAMEYQNRLLCKLADDAFSPKMLFKPTSASQSQKMNLAVFGNYAVMPNGFDLNQTAINPLIQDSLLLNREISGLLSSNLSQYRQNLQKASGNPKTATEIEKDASEQARLGKTQLNRYYEQLDGLFREKFRRACNPNLTESMPGGKAALDFQYCCKKRGVTAEDLKRVESVQATRIVGQGSVFLRQQTLEFLLGIIAMLPEEGRQRLLHDIVAARAGQTMVKRYFPEDGAADGKMADQKSQAQDKVVGMKVGIAPMVTSSQNPFIYAETYLTAAAQAVESLETGADPMEVFSFLEIAGPAIAAQLQRLSTDPTRKLIYEQFKDKWEELAKIHDQLGQRIMEQKEQEGEAMAAQQRAQSIANGTDPNTQIKAAEVKAKIAMQQEKTDAALRQKEQKFRQGLALADASTAAKISRE